MTTAEIQHVQTRIGATPDGFWGPKSTAAAQAHLRALMPSPHPFPKQSDITAFYGPHGTPGGKSPPTSLITLPFSIYYEGKEVRQLRPHEKCADSLLRVFDRLLVAYPSTAEARRAGILTYDGLYNPRPMRGGTAWSLHSWAIAIDFNAEHNSNRSHWPVASSMPIEIMECFAHEGWTAAGAFWSRDAMHFQATQP